MKREELKRLVFSALFLAIGIVLPVFTGQIKEIGDSLLPMHLPVMLCGFICGWKYGFTIGIILPFIRSLTFGMPPLYPNAIWMAVELAAYGLVVGVLHAKMINLKRGRIALPLIISMVVGRIAWGITKATLLGIGGKSFTVNAFIVGGFVDAIPGIIIQLILIPLIVGIYEDSKIKTRRVKK